MIDIYYSSQVENFAVTNNNCRLFCAAGDARESCISQGRIACSGKLNKEAYNHCKNDLEIAISQSQTGTGTGIHTSHGWISDGHIREHTDSVPLGNVEEGAIEVSGNGKTRSREDILAENERLRNYISELEN